MCSNLLSNGILVLSLVAHHVLAQGHQQPLHDLELETFSSVQESQAESPLLSLHRHLIEIESITENELAVGEWLASYLKDHGLNVQKQKVSKDRYNIIAYAGDSPETDILLSSHIDTVPPYWKYEYRPATHEAGLDKLSTGNDTIWGRGSVDAKACVAVQTLTLLELLSTESSAQKPEVDPSALSLLFVVGEETGGDGMRHFSDHNKHNYSAVVFGEPTESKLVSGHKGNLGVTIRATGKAVHSGYPWLGLSANDVLIEALAQLRAIEGRLPSSEKYGNTTVNIGRMEGGVAANVVAETAEAKVAIRIAGGTPEAVKKVIEDGLASTKKEAEEKGGKLEFIYGNLGYGPVDIDADIPGFDTITVNYGTDVPWLKGNHKRYLYGPGSIFVAHSDHEHLRRGELERAVGEYKKIIKTVLDRIKN